MKNANKKLKLIEQFYYQYLEGSKERPRMHGSAVMVEHQWMLLDHIYFLLKNIDGNRDFLSWADFLTEKGFGGGADFDTRAREWKLKDPYKALIKYRNEYERWREKRMKLTKKARKKSFASKFGKIKLEDIKREVEEVLESKK